MIKSPCQKPLHDEQTKSMVNWSPISETGWTKSTGLDMDKSRIFLCFSDWLSKGRGVEKDCLLGILPSHTSVTTTCWLLINMLVSILMLITFSANLTQKELQEKLSVIQFKLTLSTCFAMSQD